MTLNTETRAHAVARDRAMREGRDQYLVQLDGRFVILPKAPRNVEPLAGYHPSGKMMYETEETKS